MHARWEILNAFLSSPDFFSNSTFFKNSFRNTIRVPNTGSRVEQGASGEAQNEQLTPQSKVDHSITEPLCPSL